MPWRGLSFLSGAQLIRFAPRVYRSLTARFPPSGFLPRHAVRGSTGQLFRTGRRSVPLLRAVSPSANHDPQSESPALPIRLAIAVLRTPSCHPHVAPWPLLALPLWPLRPAPPTYLDGTWFNPCINSCRRPWNRCAGARGQFYSKRMSSDSTRTRLRTITGSIALRTN